MSTVNISFEASCIMGSEFQKTGQGPDAPYTVANSLEIMNQQELTLPATTVTTIAAMSNAAKVIVLIPTVLTHFVWRSAGSDADNNSSVVPANCPFILYTSALPYQTTSSNRVDETAANITGITAYSPAGAGKIKQTIWG